ncbi:MAG TPA: sugar ABC transporter ATP-binding protein [Gaiellaceae bacterium]|nr:sugar ABC transporter ATP-binding protein [Gaiellaceae bacterium]
MAEATAAAESAGAPATEGRVPLRVTGVAKRFGSTEALRDCSFELRAGEVHAILGENGSGKSTLVKILAGVHRPDEGVLELDGVEQNRIRSPRASIRAGIVTVFQEVLVVGQRSLLDNVWLGADGLVRKHRSQAEKRQRARAVLDRLLEEVPDLNEPVKNLPLSLRQACCVARALLWEPKILVLDESTSALDVATRDNLFTILNELRAGGRSVVFISHRMDEIEEIGDRVTVLRSGVSVATLDRGAATARELVELMTGREHLVTERREHDARERVRDQIVLRTRGVRVRPGAAPIDVEIRAGELVGLAGLEGHGQDRFLRILGGVAAPEEGEVVCTTRGEAVITSARDAVRQGVTYVPRDRRTESVFESRSVLDNFGLPTQDRDRRAGIIVSRKTERRFREYVDMLHIVFGRGRNLITTLSGGNQQKVITARWLAANPAVLLLNDPTRGVDIGAKHDIYRVLVDVARSGVAVVMLSTEVDEHVELMDRVLVFREGELAAEIPRGEATRRRLVANFFGERHDG